MEELIKITKDDNGDIAVSGRDLHQFLEVKTEYGHWFPRMVDYGFIEGRDFTSKMTKTHNDGRPSHDAIMTLDMAKEIAMIQRSDKGKQLAFVLDSSRLRTACAIFTLLDNDGKISQSSRFRFFAHSC